jgi:hypothetical protein
LRGVDEVDDLPVDGGFAASVLLRPARVTEVSV